jgi:NADH-quinone oxidoreductase subunit L
VFLFALGLPFLTVILIALFSRKVGSVGSIAIACLNMVASLVASFVLFVQASTSIIIDLWPWLALNGHNLAFTVRVDSNTAVMFLVVSVVSTCVHIYSSVYMYTDPHLSRFMLYLSFFTFFMLLLVSAGNLLVLFFGWEGVGLCSYLLISFWYTRAQAVKAATKAFLVNKVGDLFLLSAIAVLFSVFYTTDFSVINVLVGFAPTEIVETVCILLFIGAVGKSAQIGLHTWLPDAMEGPTPVSALIHAATMVTAGIFLIVRCSLIFENAPIVSFFVALLGGVTALISGTIGIAQNDIKKIIAYSTCSQLGYMALSAGISLYDLSLFHLFNHAFFKALLFLSAGSIIHLMNNEQDIRKMGGLASLSPFVYILILVGSLALAGFPFLAGFYSKDIIIEASYTKV